MGAREEPVFDFGATDLDLTDPAEALALMGNRMGEERFSDHLKAIAAQRAKWDAKLADASRRRAKALEALRSIHADELVDGPAPRAVENGHLEGVS